MHYLCSFPIGNEFTQKKLLIRENSRQFAAKIRQQAKSANIVIGLEDDYQDFIRNLVQISSEIKRVLGDFRKIIERNFIVFRKSLEAFSD